MDEKSRYIGQRVEIAWQYSKWIGKKYVLKRWDQFIVFSAEFKLVCIPILNSQLQKIYTCSI